MKNNYYDVAIIGGGPAGMMAGVSALEQGAHVVLLERNSRLGKKLLITGKGRCNITNAEHDINRFIEVFGQNGKFLYSALSRFSIDDAINFFNERGLATKVERGNRVFPVSDKAEDVLQLFLDIFSKSKIKVLTNALVNTIISNGSSIEKVVHSEGEIFAKNYIICTGGLSYPSTGSKGDGISWARELGHTIIPPKPALVPIMLKDAWIKEVNGLDLKNVLISVYKNKKKYDERFGDAYFTYKKISGPIILDMSKGIGKLLEEDNALVQIHIDLKPALDYKVLDERIQRDLKECNNKIFKNCLDALLPKMIIPVIVKRAGIDPLKKAHSITKEERKSLVHLLKGIVCTVTGIGGFEEAVITTGGVSLDEVDSKTMKSKIVDNLYFAGEILDIDGPTGGYNLQVCWTTGYVAGKSILF